MSQQYSIQNIQFRTGDIILMSRNNFGSKTISRVIKCEYNHVGIIYVEVRTHQVFIWEMNMNGPRLVALEEWMHRGAQVLRRDIDAVAWVPIHRIDPTTNQYIDRNNAQEYERYTTRLESWIQYCIMLPMKFNLTSFLNIALKAISVNNFRLRNLVEKTITGDERVNVPIYEQPTMVTCSGMVIASLYHLNILDVRVMDHNMTNILDIVCPTDFVQQSEIDQFMSHSKFGTLVPIDIQKSEDQNHLGAQKN